MPAFRCTTGINYRPKGKGDEVRVEAGDVVTDLPAESVDWLLEVGAIEPAPSKGVKLDG